jgi:hypothetical protein
VSDGDVWSQLPGVGDVIVRRMDDPALGYEVRMRRMVAIYAVEYTQEPTSEVLNRLSGVLDKFERKVGAL